VRRIFYRESWFDTRLEDLIVLCNKCHKKIHFDKYKNKQSKQQEITFGDKDKREISNIFNSRYYTPSNMVPRLINDFIYTGKNNKEKQYIKELFLRVINRITK